jgi:hypothetical protein
MNRNGARWICVADGCDHMLTSYRVHAAKATIGVYRHAGRGLCTPCWNRADADGTLIDYSRTTYTRDEVLDEWVELRGQGVTRRELAERLGMTWAAFERMWLRARAVGDPRAHGGDSRVGNPRRWAA